MASISKYAIVVIYDGYLLPLDRMKSQVVYN